MIFARLFRIIIAIAFFVNALLLSVSLLAPYINPATAWIPAFIGLFFKAFLAIHLFLLLVLTIGRWYKSVIAGLVILVLCLPQLQKSFAFRLSAPEKTDRTGIRLLAYNINDFGLFYHDSLVNDIFTTINRQNADILCFEEYYMKKNMEPQIIGRLQKMGYRYKYELITMGDTGGTRSGQAIFSKIPFFNIHKVPFIKTGNGAFSVDIKTDADTFRLFDVHFQSAGLRNHETRIPRSIKDFEAPQKYYYRMFFKKLMWAFEKRSNQVLMVKNLVKKSPYKVIVCGDFNDPPVSFTYRQMTEYLEDSYLKTGYGFGSTFAGRIPLQRIDYVLTDPAIKVEFMRVIHRTGSDHYPVVCDFIP